MKLSLLDNSWEPECFIAKWRSRISPPSYTVQAPNLSLPLSMDIIFIQLSPFTVWKLKPFSLGSKWQYQSVHSCTNLREFLFIGGASFWDLGHDLQGAIQYVIKRRRLSQLSLKIEVTIMLKFQGRQIKIRLIGRASPSAQHAKEWKHCLLLHLM